MDLFGPAFYAVICGLMCAFAPRFGSITARVAAGGAVGFIAPFVLEPIRLALVGY